MPGALTVREGGEERRVVFDARAVIGRDRDCTVILQSRSVSRKHAIIEKSADGWIVRDLGSANGLFVEGKRVSEAPLPSGSSVRFGDVEATFETGARRISSTERVPQSLSVPPVRRARPVAIIVAVTLAIVALVAATVWSRYCDGASKTSAATSGSVSRG
jgi:pSer/pThr/pTyr-binding forkhead associated (FHA) protein